MAFINLKARRKRPLLIRSAVVLSALLAVVLLEFSLFYKLRGMMPTLADTPPRVMTATPLVSPLEPLDYEKYTLRINSWKREEQLQISIDHFSACPGVALIQVVWCIAQGDPPAWLTGMKGVAVEQHAVNSLNERFRVLSEPPTRGILSIDDDVMRPCLALDDAFFIWTRHPDRLVGFDARTHVEQDKTDKTWKYGYLSTTTSANQYSMTLMRFCFVHVDYLKSYTTTMPAVIRQQVANNMNCEDVAMSFWVTHLTNNQPPLLASLWAIKSQVKLYSESTISGSHNHKMLRDECVDTFASIFHLKGKLQAAEWIHTTDHEPFFACGAPTSWSSAGKMSTREQELELVVDKWKGDNKRMFRELAVLGQHMALKAYQQGLINKSPPWKERFQNNKTSSS
jgi:glucuronyl/N-acetylglucosaminyl transferase EXT2